MYKSFFRLRENPFNVSVDPRFFFPTRQTEEALQRLAYGIQNRKGLVLLTGEVGTGKTMLINQLLDWLRQLRTPTAFVFNSNLGEGDLFNLMACDFGIATEPNDRTNLPIRLNSWLLECYRAGVSPVLIVDEAQGLSFERLEEIRLLLNVETPCEKMLQIVFAGQPELEDNLNQPKGRHLRQRIAVRCKISPLTLEQTHGYIEQRLIVAGAEGEAIFARQAMDAIYFYTRGVPRVINLICEHSLINAYVDQLRPVPVQIVEEVASEFELTFGFVTPSPSSIQSTFAWAGTHPSGAHEPAETQRAQAAVAGVSSHFREVSLNKQIAPVFSEPGTLSASASLAEAHPSKNDSFAPATESERAEQRRPAPLILPATAPRPTAHVSITVLASLSNPLNTKPPREARQSDTQIRSVEEFTVQRRWVTRSHTRQRFRWWWAACRDRCLTMVNTSTLRLRTLSALRWLATPTHGLANRRWQNMHYGLRLVPLRLHHNGLKWLDRYGAMIVQATRHHKTALFRWLQQPLSSAHRH
jgi:type II secretory pathway predicted ATPase ExeA